MIFRITNSFLIQLLSPRKLEHKLAAIAFFKTLVELTEMNRLPEISSSEISSSVITFYKPSHFL